MINNKKLNTIITKLFIRGRKLNIYLVFITQSYFKVLKDVRLNSNHFFVMEIPNKRKRQQIALNHSSDVNSKDFIKIGKKCTAEPCSFLVKMLRLQQIILYDLEKIFSIYNKQIMTINDQIRDEKLQYDINRKAAGYQLYHQAKLISMNILLVKIYYHLINNK